MLDRLRERVAARNSQQGRRYELSLSVGIAGYDPEAPVPLDELLARADGLMYEDKRRNEGEK
jgi:GGDEF domain-containing protein